MVYVNGEMFDVYILSGLFWFESSISLSRYVDFVEVDLFGVFVGIKFLLKMNIVCVDLFL